MPPRKIDDSIERRLKVQTGVVKRMKKEVASYEKEVITNEARVQKMRDEGRDEYDIRKQEEVLQESYMMIPDSKNRLGKAVDELDQILQQAAEEENINAEVLEEAKALVAELAVE